MSSWAFLARRIAVASSVSTVGRVVDARIVDKVVTVRTACVRALPICTCATAVSEHAGITERAAEKAELVPSSCCENGRVYEPIVDVQGRINCRAGVAEKLVARVAARHRTNSGNARSGPIWKRAFVTRRAATQPVSVQWSPRR